MKSVNGLCNVIRKGGERGADNERGNAIHRMHHHTERYLVDFADEFSREGWEQFDTDQDAWYFGVWVNPKTKTTLTYCEGDWSVVDCPTVESYNAEIQSMIEFYGEGFIAKAIDKDGAMTTLVQDRSKFLIHI